MQEMGEVAVHAAHRESPSPVELVLGMVPEWDELLASNLELSASLLGARWCALYLLDPERKKLMLARLWDGQDRTVSGSWDVPEGEFEWQVVEGSGSVITLRPKREWLDGCAEGEDARLYSCAYVPVDVEGSRFGVVEVVRGLDAAPFAPVELAPLELVARHLGLWLRNSAILQRLRELAITDGLTEVYNHRYFQDRLEMELERAARYSRPVSIAMMDLDGFKRYNDLFGHRQGDRILRLTALAIQRVVRRVDVVARYGGDEFAVILPETGSLQALVVANRMSNAVLGLEIPASDSGALEKISASIGVSSYPATAQNREELICQADEALYRAKRNRGRKVRLWETRWRRKASAAEAGSLPA